MTLSFAIVNTLTEERREVPINRSMEHLEFTLVNGSERPVVIRQWLGDYTTWLGVDGYGQPGVSDNEASQVKLDVHHVGLTEEDSAYDSEMPPHPYVQVQTKYAEEDPRMIFLSNMRLLDKNEALEMISRITEETQRLERLPGRALLDSIEDVLGRVKKDE